MSQIIPVSRVPLNIRVATMDNIPFIDALQKKHSKQVGWMPTQQLEGKIKAGHVLVAEQRVDGREVRVDQTGPLSTFDPPPSLAQPVGYVIGNDQYFKRDDVGIIYQLNVAPVHHRSLVGATLIKALFDRAAYGCKLFCCWCAQDIEANYFWESLGFVPLAFRTGSRSKGAKGTPRIHIFWQRRIREGDETTSWWFPSKTDSGSIREDRIVLPIPPGVRWSEVRAVILPSNKDEGGGMKDEGGALRARKARPATKLAAIPRLGATFSIPLPGEKPVAPAPVSVSKREAQSKPRRKHDPKLVAAARELRDRWIEHVAANPAALAGAGKYDVARALPDRSEPARVLLPAA